MRVLVTGASGFIGTELCAELLRRGHNVTAAVRRDGSAPAGTSETVVPDVGPDTDWTAALKGQEAVVHLAARVHVMTEMSDDPITEFRRVNSEGTLHLAKNAANSDVGRFIFLSSIKAQGESTTARPFDVGSPARPQDPYGITKLEAEKGLHRIAESSNGMSAVAIRTPLVYGARAGGNFNRLMRLIQRGVPLPIRSARNQRTMIGLRNLIDLIGYELERRSDGFHLTLAGDSEALSTSELAFAIGEGLNKPARLVRFSPRALRIMAHATGRSAEIGRLMDSLEVTPGSTDPTFSWNPPEPARIGIARAAAEWLSNTRNDSSEFKAAPKGSSSSADLNTAFITQWFPPEPTPIPLYIARALSRADHKVSVLTGIPNYPTGHVVAGYRSWRPVSEQTRGFEVRRSPLVASHDSSAVKRMINYMSWAFATSLLQLNRLRLSDVVLVFSSPATAAIPAMVSRALFKTPYVLYIQDLWPDSVTAAGFVNNRRIASVIDAVLTAYTKRTYRSADQILVLSPGMIDELVRRGVQRRKISLVYNWANEDETLHPVSRLDARKAFAVGPDSFVVTYAGNHGAAQSLETVVRAASLIEDPRICFLFFGDGLERSRLEALAQELRCANLKFMGPVPPADMPAVEAVSDIQLVSLARHELFEITLPSKVQGILASGSPILAVAAGDAAAVVRDSGSGWAVSPGDVEGLANQILMASRIPAEALARMGRSGRRYYDRHMSESVGSARLDSSLRSAARGRDRPDRKHHVG